MSQRKIEYRLLDNAFGWVADLEQAQMLADHFSVEMVHRKLDEFADRYCPVIRQFGLSYHWSLDQVEFATDIVFARQADWQAIYDRLTRAAIHTVKPDNIATFLGRKLNGNYQDEMGNRFHTRIEGTRIQHTMGPVTIQMYDQFRLILRIQTTVDHVSTLPPGGTPGRHAEHGVGRDEEDHLQSGAAARTVVGRPPALPGVHLHPRG